MLGEGVNSRRNEGHRMGYTLGLEAKGPVAVREVVEHRYHTPINDAYHWMRNSTRALGYLEDENEFGEDTLAPLQPLVDKIFHELKAKAAVRREYPFREGDFTYFNHILGGYARYYRVRGNVKETVMDFNRFEQLSSIGGVYPSVDNRWLAYTVDLDGSEEYTLFLRNLATAHEFSVDSGTAEKVVWSADSNRLYYMKLDLEMRPSALIQYDVLRDETLDIYEEGDKAFALEIYQSTSRELLFLKSATATSSEIRYLCLTSPASPLLVISPRMPNRLYSAEHHGNRFVILANLHNGTRYVNNILLEASLARPAEWAVLVDYDPSRFICSVFAMQKFLVLEVRVGGYLRIEILADKTKLEPKFKDQVFYARVAERQLQYSSDTVPIVYSSPITPDSLYEFNTTSAQMKLLMQDKSGHDASKYTTKRFFSSRGVPISLIYKKGRLEAGNPLVLEGYGSYGISLEMEFLPQIFSLLDRNFIYAVAHVRGGSELGRSWYEDEGRLLNKRNSFLDFADCASFLLESKFTSSIAAIGSSAGGLLVAATVNERPELFRTAVLRGTASHDY